MQVICICEQTNRVLHSKTEGGKCAAGIRICIFHIPSKCLFSLTLHQVKLIIKHQLFLVFFFAEGTKVKQT